MTAEQSIQFTSAGGRRIAWASVGEGPPLVIGGWWMSHLELDWANPRFRAFVQAIAQHRTVVRYDRPGTGLSDRDGPPPTSFDEELAAFTEVVDAIGVAPVAMFPSSGGGPVAAAFAAEHPERVTHIAFYGSYPDGSEVADAHSRAAMVGLVRTHWGIGSRVLADVFIPTATAEERAAFVEFQRLSAPAEVAARSLEAVYSYSARELLGEIHVPTLVIHRRDDRAIPFELGQRLASAIPGATFRPLPGADHLPWYGDARSVATCLLDFLGIEDELEALEGHAAPQLGTADGELEGELSDRELEILRLVAMGLGDREIAEQLTLSPHTVHRHVANIRTKLRLPSRAAAAAHAARLGLL